MKLTKERLKQIIKEELSTMQEGSLQMRDTIEATVRQLADTLYGGDMEFARGGLISYLRGDRSGLGDGGGM